MSVDAIEDALEIEPDIAVPAEQALTVAHREALQHLLAKANSEQERDELREALGQLS